MFLSWLEFYYMFWIFYFSDERVITKFKEEISQAFLHDLRSVNQEENKFWKDLIRACLEPASDAFGFEEILKGTNILIHFLKANVLFANILVGIWGVICCSFKTHPINTY